MKYIKKYNLLLFMPLLILNIISLFNMINAPLINSSYNNVFFKQLLWIILSYIIFFIINKNKANKIFKISNFIYLISIVLLILVLFIGKDINGAKCWLNIFGFSFQPSELAKLSLCLILINVINKNKPKSIKEEFILVTKLSLITLIPTILVFLEPDTGAIINFFIIFLLIFCLSKLNKIWYISFFCIICSLIAIFFVMYFCIQDTLINILGTSLFYRMDRLINFANGSSYQLETSLITIGASSFFGSGFNKILLYIPEAPTDFIFSFSIGNFGILSALLIIISYLILDIYLLKKAHIIKNKKYKLFICCYLGILTFHQIYNIFMNIGLLPIMGIPLPFVSYGGTNTLMNYIFLAIIYNFSKEKNI